MTRKKSTLSRRPRQKASSNCRNRLYGKIGTLFVKQLPNSFGCSPRGIIQIGGQSVLCAIGRGGIGPKHREGDGITPIGKFRINFWLYRADSWKSLTLKPIRRIKPRDGWCDDPESQSYNRPLNLPAKARAEELWREDRLYDLVGVIDFNIKPRTIGRGSAIFFHLAHDDLRPTAGCIALRPRDMKRIQSSLGKNFYLQVGQHPRRQRSPKIAEPTRT